MRKDIIMMGSKREEGIPNKALGMRKNTSTRCSGDIKNK